METWTSSRKSSTMLMSGLHVGVVQLPNKHYGAKIDSEGVQVDGMKRESQVRLHWVISR